MHISSVLLLATALSGAAAHPSPLAHRHAAHHIRAHQAARDDSGGFVKAVRPESTPAPAEPTPEPAPEPEKPQEQAQAVAASASNGGKKAFCDGDNTLASRATLAQISYKGNTGAAGKWGCNIMQIDCSTIDLYDYTARFDATDSSPSFSCSAFNKIGPEGKIDGFWFSALDFTVSKGNDVCLAFDSDSQGGVACGAGKVPRTSNGQLAGSWAEFDAGSSPNGGQSGADVSVIVADVNGMTDWVSMSISAPGKGVCSRLSKANPSLDLEVYRGGDEDLDGVGCKGYSKGTIFVTLGD